MDLERALSIIKADYSKTPFDEEAYLGACTYVADHRDELTQRVFFDLPGGLSGNTDPKWDYVKKHSDERCGCGNERTFLPGNQRTEYQPSDIGEIIVSPDNEVYLKPVGGDKTSTYLKLWIEEGGMAFMGDPFAPFVVTPDLFTTKAYDLEKLEEVLPDQPTPPVMVHGKEKTPLFAINAVDAAAKKVTITPDMDVEGFNPDTYKDGHGCETS